MFARLRAVKAHYCVRTAIWMIVINFNAQLWLVDERF
jgi:hypothetical protein